MPGSAPPAAPFQTDPFPPPLPATSPNTATAFAVAEVPVAALVPVTDLRDLRDHGPAPSRCRGPLVGASIGVIGVIDLHDTAPSDTTPSDTAPSDPAPLVLPSVPARSALPPRRLLSACQRARDLLITVPALLLLVPLLVVVGLAVLVCDGRPVLFRQRRVGRHGREFTMVKFRSMVRDAEARKADLAHRNERGGPLFKVSHDPRVTRLGRVLRDTSLDELPQLLNVVAGHMSLVGPRPALPSEVVEFDEDHRRRHEVRPGITGLWQVAPPEAQAFAHYRRFDLQYLEERSLRLDLVILLRTAARVGTSVLARVARRSAPQPQVVPSCES